MVLPLVRIQGDIHAEEVASSGLVMPAQHTVVAAVARQPAAPFQAVAVLAPQLPAWLDNEENQHNTTARLAGDC
jgi:hypothetical protein